MTAPLSIRKLGRGATPCCCFVFFLSYFDQNGLLGREGGRELDLNVFFLL